MVCVNTDVDEYASLLVMLSSLANHNQCVGPLWVR
ncbi:MAG: hypothetical protein RLY41_604, partial [Pseudomonadota bacterium]